MKRFWAVRRVSAATMVLAAAACHDNDHTELCVGPGCPQYDGVGGKGNVLLGNGGSSGEAGSSGAAGTPGTAGSAGSSGTGGAAGSGPTIDPPDATAPDATAPDADAGPLDPPDADLPVPIDGGDAQAPLPCELAFAAPTAPDAGDLTLTLSDDVDGDQCGSEFTIDVTLNSNARSVTLFVNENPLVAQDVLSGAVTFATILGNRGSTGNVLRAEATMPNGDTCSAAFPSSVFVDCPGPSCTIDSPVANDDSFLNASQDSAPGTSGLQTEIVVSTELEHLGEVVRLELDADPDAVPDEVVTNSSGNGIATFAVTLAEGERTVQAECRDAFGVTTLSSPVVWKVDVTPCTLTLASIGGGANPITPEDDEDGATGIQVFATGTIAGSNCTAVRVGVCNELLSAVTLSQPLSGAFSGLVTLTPSASGPLQLCGVVEDDAGNVSAEAQLTVNVRVDEPQVAFVSSPPDLTSQNESAPLTPTCETSVAVNCSELGQPVELLQDGLSLGTQNCDDVGGTAPLVGRATFSTVSLTSKNDGTTTTLTARQSATGFAPATAEVAIHADCEGPACTLASPSASLDFLTVDSDTGTPGFESDFSVTSDPTGATARLILDGNVGGALSASLGVLGGGTGATFLNVPLSEAQHTARFECVDSAGNVTTTTTEDWTVDTLACTPDLVIAGGDLLITPTDDLDIPALGLTVLATGQPAGGDCTEVVVGLGACSGVTDPFTALDANQDFSLPIVLAEATGTQAVCVKVKDAAGHVSEATVTATVRVTPPLVGFSFPSQGDHFNLTSTGACDQTVLVSCEAGGDPVELFVDTVSAGTAPCSSGTASFPVTLATKNDGSLTTLAAQQTADGFTSALASITVQADCQAPVPSITSPVCGGPLLALPENDLDLIAAGLQADVTVANDGVATVTLSGAPGGPSTATGDTVSTTFSALDLGGPGVLSLTACATDAQLNTGCSAVCVLTVAAHPSLDITSPTALTLFTPSSTDCDLVTAGLQVTVSGTTNAAAGSQVQLQLGAGAIKTATATGTDFSDCVDAPDGNNQTLTASVTDLLTNLISTTSIQVSVDTQGPDAIVAPTFSVVDRRLGQVQLNWVSTLDTDGDPLAAYQVRCAASDITSQGTWDAATPLTVTTSPAATAGVAQSEVFTLPFKTGTTRFCVVRGQDSIGLLSPIAGGLSATVTNPFLSQRYVVVDDPNTGPTVRRVVVEPLGDINGDKIPDFAYGASLRKVQVFFGKTTIGNNATESADFEILFGGTGSQTNTTGFGSEVAGLGDISGDGIPDFAVGAPGANAVFVFFGKSGNTWGNLDVDTNQGDGCEADLCIFGTGLGLFGWDVHGANVDGTGANDLVIAARTAATAGQVFVLLAGTQFTSGATLTVQNATALPNPDGFVIKPPASRSDFGYSVGAIGNQLLIGSFGAGGGNPGAFYSLPAQSPPAAGSGMTSLTSPTLVELASGTGANFGFPVRALGDYNGHGADFASAEAFAGSSGGGTATIYLGENGFSVGTKLSFSNDLVPARDDNYGTFIAGGGLMNMGDLSDADTLPDIVDLGDLDGDGFGELLVGSTIPDTPAGAVGTAQMFYGALDAVGRTRSSADFSFTSTLTSGQVVPNFVGDINGDGFKDFALLDSGNGANVVFLLY